MNTCVNNKDINYKVSIIVPAYNVSEYIEKCTYSILNQSYKNIEVIAINDGSTDNTLEILNRISQNDNRIKILDTPNSGVSAARNAGIEVPDQNIDAVWNNAKKIKLAFF